MDWHKNCSESDMRMQPLSPLCRGPSGDIRVRPDRTGTGNAGKFGKTPADSTICRQIVRRTEKTLNLPIGILQAISLAESGRWDKSSRSHFAWPWTVTARGKGLFYPSKAAAISAVRKLQADGVENIDVDCMQVNLKYHPEAFADLHEAFDPAANARYAANLFTKLREANRSINRAVAHYHSTTRERNMPYTRKVMRLWNQERRRQNAAGPALTPAGWPWLNR